MTSAIRAHWREYGSEALCLAIFMISAATFATLLQHPASPLARHGSSVLSRLPMGIAMGLTAIALVYSRLGQRSGAHMNPAVTITFFRLGKIGAVDMVIYIAAQFAGGLVGIVAATIVLAELPADPSVNYVATLPGPAGAATAFVAEGVISCGLMLVILVVSNHARWKGLTGICAGLLVCLYITLEAPLSGMSMNAARSFGPALLAGSLDSLWIYFLAPLGGMLLASEVFVRRAGRRSVRCAKLHHPSDIPCIFRCQFGEVREVSA
jgi:aquaporin Z